MDFNFITFKWQNQNMDLEIQSFVENSILKDHTFKNEWIACSLRSVWKSSQNMFCAEVVRYFTFKCRMLVSKLVDVELHVCYHAAEHWDNHKDAHQTDHSQSQHSLHYFFSTPLTTQSKCNTFQPNLTDDMSGSVVQLHNYTSQFFLGTIWDSFIFFLIMIL